MHVKKIRLLLNKVAIGLLLMAVVLASFAYAAPSVSAEETSGLPLTGASASVSEDAKTVTVTASVYAAQAPELVDLKTAITVKRTGASDFAALAANDTVTLTNTESSATLVLTLDSALTGESNSISIAAGALVDSTGSPYDSVLLEDLPGLDITPPAFTGARSGTGEGSYVYLNFKENITINSGETDPEDFLRSQISIATDGIQFKPLLEGTVRQYGTNRIYISYDNDMQFILGPNTLIKIQADTLKDAVGNLNGEMILNIASPVIQSVDISSDYHDVTITFDEAVYDNTIYDGVSGLNEEIYLLRNGAESEEWEELGVDDSISIDGNKMTIHFATPLTGAANLIIIDGGALKDSYGNFTNDEISTPLIAGNMAGESTPPQRTGAYLSNGDKDITIVFDEEVLNNRESLESLKGSIRYHNPSTWQWVTGLPADATVVFSENKLTVHFTSSIFSSGGYVTNMIIPPDSIKDIYGNVIHHDVSSWDLYPNQTLTFQYGQFSHNGRWVTLDFNKEIADNTIVDGISHLKEKVSLSKDQGATYTPLNEQDVVAFYEDKMAVFFHDPIQAGSVRMKIEAEAISDQFGNLKIAAIDETIAYNTPELTGYFFSNAASEFTFEDNEAWRSSVKDVIIFDDENWAIRPLNSSEYTLTAGKLTINPGVFEQGVEYYVEIRADGYSSKFESGIALPSAEIFYMTAPAITSTDGITATIDVLHTYPYSYHGGNQAVVFELMDGSTPVSIVSAKLSVNTGTYSANFNVTDAATNPDYTVRAFIVSEFDTDPASVGINLGKQVTQAEFDLKQFEVEEQMEDYWEW